MILDRLQARKTVAVLAAIDCGFNGSFPALAEPAWYQAQV
jgi:hypothetical protein